MTWKRLVCETRKTRMSENVMCVGISVSLYMLAGLSG